MKRAFLLLTLFALPLVFFGQDLKFTFTSITDAKFFVYLNGVLQNKHSSGMVTVKNLEDKVYHVRIVIDDPFEVAVTQSMRPDPKHSEYTVQFNAVKERVYLKRSKTQHEEEQWLPGNNDDNQATHADPQKPKPRPNIRRTQPDDAETQQLINRIRLLAPTE